MFTRGNKAQCLRWSGFFFRLAIIMTPPALRRAAAALFGFHSVLWKAYQYLGVHLSLCTLESARAGEREVCHHNPSVANYLAWLCAKKPDFYSDWICLTNK